MINHFKIFTLLFILLSPPCFAKDRDYVKVITSPVTNNPFTSIYERYQDKSYDFDQSFKDSVAGLLRAYVLRYDSINNFHVVFYSDNKYDSHLGYWVGISNDNGLTWQRYYTGIGDCRPYYIKYKPQISLIKNDSIIEIEAAEVKQISQEALPSSPAEYGLTKDNLLIQININALKKDSDNDGLTDLVEEKLFTNPFSKDTDKDGIDDFKDTNPRYKNKKDKYAALYRHLINASGTGFADSMTIPFNEIPNPLKEKRQYPIPTYIIVTDDTHIQHVSATDERIIILNTLEWNLYDKKHLSTPKNLYVSSLKPAKAKQNQYTVTIDEHGFGVTYQITERKGFWILKMIGMWQA